MKNNNLSERLLFSTTETAAILGVCLATINKAISFGSINVVHLGSHPRVNRNEINRLLRDGFPTT